MEARELRIGNWVKDRTDANAKYFKVDCHDICNIAESVAENLNYNPIPLTEEILLKCGFECIEKDNSGGDYRHRNYKWFQFFFNSKSILKYGAFTQLIHLHQLQNLHFAITGEELDIDLSR